MGELFKKSDNLWRIPRLQLNTIHQIAASKPTVKPELPPLKPESSNAKFKWRKSLAKAVVVEKFAQKQEYR